MHPAIAIPAITALIYRAYSRRSLTPLGVAVAALTALVHAAHPSSAPFAFLVVFFLGGTATTKVKHDVKARLTISAMGGSGSLSGSSGESGGVGGEGPRTHVQVLANSAVASILVVVHLLLMKWRKEEAEERTSSGARCFAYGDREGLLLVGITANYAAVAADTFSSELGILASSSPRLITSPTLRKVPKGTNGGVTLLGVGAGTLGAFTIAITSVVLLPFCSAGAEASPAAAAGVQETQLWSWQRKLCWVAAVTLWGALGSIVDSILGGLLQATVVDKRTGKVVEGSGGQKVLVHPGSMTSTGFSSDANIRRGSNLHTTEDIANALTPRKSRTEYDPLGSHHEDKKDDDVASDSRHVDSGFDLLDNNQINLLMAAIMSVGGMAAASWVWDVQLF